MQPILEWGIEAVLWFQQFSPMLDAPFASLTFLGDEEFFLLLLPFVYWCVDRHSGARLIVLFLCSTYLNAMAKELVDQPRPFEYDSRVKMIREAYGGGLPSGHTQGAVVVWGYMSTLFKRRWLWTLAAVLMVLIPISRVYLGVHFPHDLLGGYLLGGAVLALYIWLAPVGERWLDARGFAWQVGLSVVVALAMALSFSGEDSVTAGATVAGMGIGFAIERRWIRFTVGNRWWKRAVAFLLGVIVIAGLWGGLRLAFADLEPALVYRFVRYGLTGLWGAAGAPAAFVQLGLADRQSE
jgi:membrane-associated phospholipid phosphatase